MKATQEANIGAEVLGWPSSKHLLYQYIVSDSQNMTAVYTQFSDQVTESAPIHAAEVAAAPHQSVWGYADNLKECSSADGNTSK